MEQRAGGPGRRKLKSACTARVRVEEPSRVMPPDVMRPTKG